MCCRYSTDVVPCNEPVDCCSVPMLSRDANAAASQGAVPASSNMDQCLVLTSAVTALPAVSEPTDEEEEEEEVLLEEEEGGDGGDARSGLVVKPAPPEM